MQIFLLLSLTALQNNWRLTINIVFVLDICQSILRLHHMPTVTSYIINNVLYLNIVLPLQQIRAPIMKLYFIICLLIYPFFKKHYSSCTKLHIIHPYIVINNNQYDFLEHDFEKTTTELHVPITALLIFDKSHTNCCINVVELAYANIIITQMGSQHQHFNSLHNSMLSAKQLGMHLQATQFETLSRIFPSNNICPTQVAFTQI